MTDNELREAIKKAINKDFKELYVKEFTTDWKAQRLVRSLEVGVHTFSNIEKLIQAREKQAKLEVTEGTELIK